MIDPDLVNPVDCKCDMWALGCILFALCYNKLPFDDDEQEAIREAKYCIPAEKSNRYSNELNYLISKLIS